MARSVYRLYLIHMEGCGTCAQVRPIVREWADQHPLVRYTEFDMATEEWKATSWMPTQVPTIVLLRPDGRMFTKTGPWNIETLPKELGDFARRVTHHAWQVC